jgi:hypothetical protein
MNDHTAHDPAASLQDGYAIRLTRLVASGCEHLGSVRTSGSNEVALVYLQRFDDTILGAARRIGPPRGNPDSVLAALADLAALRREIEIETFAREHCILGGMEDLEAARQCATANYDARKRWSDDQLAAYWATVPVPRPEAS